MNWTSLDLNELIIQKLSFYSSTFKFWHDMTLGHYELISFQETKASSSYSVCYSSDGSEYKEDLLVYCVQSTVPTILLLGTWIWMYSITSPDSSQSHTKTLHYFSEQAGENI